MPSWDNIRSEKFFKHPKFWAHNTPGDIGLIKLERPVKVYRDGPHHVVNIICLPDRGFRLKGIQIAKIAGSGPGLNRVKTGSTRLREIPSSHLITEYFDFGLISCQVRSLSQIYLVL